MRVLFVAPYAPSRLRARAYGFVRHLARQHEVNVLALGLGELTQGAMLDIGDLRREGIPVTVIQEPRYWPYLRTLKSAVVPWGAPPPLQVAYTASPALRAAITTELRARWYDVVHVEHVRGLASLSTEVAAPVVWDAVDCVSLLFANGAHQAASPLLHALGPLEARRLRAYERRQLERLRQVLVTSEHDRQALLKLAEVDGAARSGVETAEITVVPNGIDRHRFHPQSVERQPDTLIFSGKMDYHANVAGALMLAQRIMPLIWRERPAARLMIAGSNPPLAVRQLARDPRITVTGYVRDLNALMCSASVAISSLPYAVGIQNKVLEAMAAGTPVVASACAARGLQAVPGRDLLVAETPDGLAAAALHLLADRETWHAVAEHGACYVAQHHDWDTLVERLTTVYERAREAVAARIPVAAAHMAARGHTTHSLTLAYAGGWNARRERMRQAQADEAERAALVGAHRAGAAQAIS